MLSFRFLKKAEGLVKRLTNNPDDFIFIERKKDGTYDLPEGYSKVRPVGSERSVKHLTYHDMADWAVRQALTDLRYFEGLEINAVHVMRPQILSENTGITYYQPLHLRK